MTLLRSFLAGFWGPAALAAALLWAAFAPFAAGWTCAALAWAVLYASSHVRGAAKAGRQAFVANLAFFLVSLSWISPLDPASWIFVSLWCGAIEGVHARLLRGAVAHAARTGSMQWVGAAALARLFTDMVRTTLATGFPWHLLGYAAWDTPAVDFASVAGVHGITCAVALLAAGLAEVHRRCAAPASGSATAVASAAGPSGASFTSWAPWRLAIAPLLPAVLILPALKAVDVLTTTQESEEGFAVRALVLQPSIAQANKERLLREGGERATVDMFWEVPERLAADAHRREPEQPDFVVWPETMIPPYLLRPFVRGAPPDGTTLTSRGFERDPRGTTAKRVARAARGAATLGGVITIDTAGKDLVSHNTAVLLDKDGGVLGWQDKRHLTPGGEYLPIVDLLPWRDAIRKWYVEKFGMIADLAPGDGVNILRVPPRSGGPDGKLGVLICYESLFPELSRDLANAGADFLVNVANYGWFAETAQMEQALSHAAFRAAECGRPFLLASNNGITAHFDRRGRLLGRTRADEPATLAVVLRRGAFRGLFLRAGEGMIWGLGAVGVLWLAVLGRRRTSPEAAEKARETS